jgi:uncharacterized protein YbdZ (MbtH family)
LEPSSSTPFFDGWSQLRSRPHEGRPGSREECLAYVEAVWTDMTPLSLRKKAVAA